MEGRGLGSEVEARVDDEEYGEGEEEEEEVSTSDEDANRTDDDDDEGEEWGEAMPVNISHTIRCTTRTLAPTFMALRRSRRRIFFADRTNISCTTPRRAYLQSCNLLRISSFSPSLDALVSLSSLHRASHFSFSTFHTAPAWRMFTPNW